jgi:hypothetical protein
VGLALVALALVPTGGVAAAPAPQTASIFVSSTGSDDLPCTHAAPCRTFARAYSLAKPGAIVEIAAGTYPEQTIPQLGAPRGSQPIVFQPAKGAKVTLTSLVVLGSHVEFRDLPIDVWTTKPTADSVTFTNITNKGFWIEGSSNVSIIRGSVGPGLDFHPIISPNEGVPPRNILIYRVYFHDWTASSSEIHTECLQVGAADGLVIRRSRFHNCAVMDLFFSYFGAGPFPKNITVENNYFDVPVNGYYAALFASYPDVWENVRIAYNSALSTLGFDRRPQLVNVQMIGNIGPNAPSGCSTAIMYAYNVWDGARCSATDLNAPSGFVDPASLDLRLRKGAGAIGHGDPAYYPHVDVDGRKRPFGKRVDAGASESPYR